jgi:anti-sigma regulatory factor (Ser/Thr protein kinase)
MEMTTHRRLVVTERSQISAARIEARALADAAGFSEQDAHRAGLVVTELASNLVKHATDGGEILLRILRASPPATLEVLSLDRGPGIGDMARAFQDGVSSGHSPGTGLGAIRRLSDVFDIHSGPSGTAMLAHLSASRLAAEPAARLVGGVSVPIPGETVCGDLWTATATAGDLTVVIADGLGHGPGAHEAARAVLAAVDPALEPSVALDRAHGAVRHTRGAAAAVARLRPHDRAVVFAGVGNISGVVADNGTQHHMVSANGTLGHQIQHIRQYTYPWPADGVLVFFSDGLASHWTLAQHPGLGRRHPALIAAVLYRDHARRRDDVTVVVAKAL